MLSGPARTIRSARVLRQTMSLPEVLLWQVLRMRPQGHKFRRQHPAGPYVLDFYCAASGLAIEVDGAAHDCADRPDRDGQRDRYLAALGVETLRLAARDVLDDLEASVRLILVHADARRPLRRAAPATSPAGGGPAAPPRYGGATRSVVEGHRENVEWNS
ncbi:MAG: DUF559 domain-containing protein [Sphingomonadales bacterium]|nr:MAG: DUF559 domain-containing protein [Sphingomonadales bacterium]